MDASVQELLNLEWRLFDEASQAGQRPALPEDRERFTITRSSQLLTWTPALRESWRQDLQTAEVEGRNLINEKYIYMLERIQPDQYDILKKSLPEPNLEKLWLVDWICQAEAAWQEALVKKYPRLTQDRTQLRNIPDCQEDVPFETRLRSELMTCSVNTLRLYARQVEHSQKAGENLCETILGNTVRQLGLESLDKAESDLKRADPGLV